MTIAETFLPEFDRETATTRKLIEAIPESRADWKPHPKSMSMRELALHLAEIPMWATQALTNTEVDVNPPGSDDSAEPEMESSTESIASALVALDRNVTSARGTISTTSDAEIMVPWTLKNRGATVMTLPRASVLRLFVLSHLIHHRAQLGVYLRLNDIPLPSVYGPTADVPM